MLYQIFTNAVWQTVAALIAIIASTIAIIRFIHGSQLKKKNLWYCLTIFLTVLLIAGTCGVIYSLAPRSTAASDPSSPTTSSTLATSVPPIASSSNSPTPTTTQASSLIEVPLSIGQPSGQNLSAVLYFGQLGVLLQKHTEVGFSVDSNYAQQHGQLCVETVVVNNISGNTAVIYNSPVSEPSDPHPWTAVKEAGSQSTLAQNNYSVYQQLIVPAENIEVGTVFVTQAQVVIDQNIKAMTATYRLTLKSITGPQAQWDIQKSDGTDAGTVECNT